MLPPKYKKRSFLKFDVTIDIEAIQREYDAIPEDAWVSSYWGDIHCSVGTLLLRGGTKGAETDYYSNDINDHPLLDNMPAIKALIASDGPFGGANYAFVFRTEPNGVTLQHSDNQPKWADMYRIHVPIKTNPGAFLISAEKSQHFERGFAWSFDNQTLHGVVNGPIERIHLIFDVPFNETLAQRIDEANHLAGKKIPAHLDKIRATSKAKNSYPGDAYVGKFINQLRQQGKDDRAIASALNARKIPTKQYVTKNTRHVEKKWNFKMVSEY